MEAFAVLHSIGMNLVMVMLCANIYGLEEMLGNINDVSFELTCKEEDQTYEIDTVHHVTPYGRRALCKHI